MAATNWAIWVATAPIDVTEFHPANELPPREICQVGGRDGSYRTCQYINHEFIQVGQVAQKQNHLSCGLVIARDPEVTNGPRWSWDALVRQVADVEPLDMVSQMDCKTETLDLNG
ncbi:wall-associated receptor kinase 2-like [Dorcoceras hygrometricum]|uniref:Wall-associated receptor kinase 2-like n=1 Tax=Dorcoceras hygrometricum TaxID=472368 RepID=A0A2Z7B1Z5_9LAMI|nr:wall-associated receptor kinase 2-like [Dorcoceras hygrometricum]